MPEPVSATVAAGKATATTAKAAETSAEVTKVVETSVEATEIGEVGKELNEVTLHGELDKIKEQKKLGKATEFQNQFKETVENSDSFNMLESNINDFEAGGSRSATAIKELNDSNIKGQLGEAISNAEKRSLGKVDDQVLANEGKNRLDMTVDLENNTEFHTLGVNQVGGINNQAMYMSEVEKVAIEVKNGSLDYLDKEIQNNHLLEQIKAGNDMADYSLVEINKDAYTELLNNPEKGKNIIAKVNEAGGEIAVGLPEYDKQKEFLLNIGRMS